MNHIQIPAVPVTSDEEAQLNRVVQASTHRLSLRTNFIWTFVGNIVYAGCQWGMLIVLAKLGTPEMVGQFALALAVTAPVIMFTNLQIRGVQATDARRQYPFGDYLGLRLITTVLALLLIGAISLFSGYGPETAATIMIIGLAKGFESISDVFYGLLQQHERMDRIAISMMIKGVLSLTVLAAGVYITGGILWGAIGLAVTWALILASYDIHSGRLVLIDAAHDRESELQSQTKLSAPLHPRWQVHTLAKLAWLALPLGIVMMLISLNTNIPRYFIEHYLGERDLGFFAAMAYVMVAGGTVVNALGQAATPRLARYYAAGNRAAFRVLLRRLTGIGATLGGAGILVALVAGRPLLLVLYRSEYAQHADVFAWLMVAAGISYVASFLGYGITAARYFKVQTPLFLAVTASTLVACAVLVPSLHLLGAAFAGIIVALIQLMGSSAVVVYVIRHIVAEVPS